MFSQSASHLPGRGGGRRGVVRLAGRTRPGPGAARARSSAYLAAQEQQVRIIDTGQDTLTGKSGSVPVSINNRLGQAGHGAAAGAGALAAG